MKAPRFRPVLGVSHPAPSRPVLDDGADSIASRSNHLPSLGPFSFGATVGSTSKFGHTPKVDATLTDGEHGKRAIDARCHGR